MCAEKPKVPFMEVHVKPGVARVWPRCDPPLCPFPVLFRHLRSSRHMQAKSGLLDLEAVGSLERVWRETGNPQRPGTGVSAHAL